MVRLKESCKDEDRVKRIISIPYGAIKRIFQNGIMITKCLISIPYGAIKRVGDNAFYYSQFKFQFLMVRLKDLQRWNKKCHL